MLNRICSHLLLFTLAFIFCVTSIARSETSETAETSATVAISETAETSGTEISAIPQTVTKLRVGYFPNAGYFDIVGAGSFSGYNYEYFQEIAQYNNWEYEFVKGTHDMCLQWLDEGKIDLLCGTFVNRDPPPSISYSKLSTGYTVSGFYVPSDDDVFAVQNYEGYAGKKIGLAEGYQYNDVFVKMLAEKGIPVEYVTFDHNVDLIDALQGHIINGAFIIKNGAWPGVTMVDRFADQSTYIGVKKGNDKLLSQIDSAMTRISQIDHNFSEKLFDKHFKLSRTTTMSPLTHEERSYIMNLPVLKVSYDPTRHPFEFYDPKTNTMNGATADVMKLVSEYSGLKFEYVKYANYGEALDRLKSGEVDILLGFFRDFEWAGDKNCRVSVPYVTAPVTKVTRKNNFGKQNKIALVDNNFLSLKLARLYPDATIIYLPSIDDCLHAVSTGMADSTFGNSYYVNYEVAHNGFYNLSLVNVNDFSVDLAIGVSRHANPLLLSIINKGLKAIGPEKMNEIISKHAVVPASNGFAEYYYTHPVRVGIVCTGLFVLIVIILLVFLVNKSRSKKRMEQLHYFDRLTGFSNINNFNRLVPQFLQKYPDAHYAIIYFDLIGFKFINDTYGYEEGDAVLKKVAEVLEQFVDPTAECFARSGSDHFVLFLTYETKADIDARIKRLTAEMDMLSQNTENSYRFMFTAGIYMMHAGENLTLSKAMDFAYFAKKNISNRHVTTHAYFDDSILINLQEENAIDLVMRQALQDGEFVIYLQPKINSVSGNLVGAEALVRWKKLDGKVVSPNKFIPYFEKSGFVKDLDMHVYECVCKLARKWLDAGYDFKNISCNFSYHDIADPNFVADIKRIADMYEVPSNMIELELTETVAVEHLHDVETVLKQVGELGFLRAIDDFGTGYSSLALLQRLPFNVLKLDRAVVQNALRHKISKDIITSLVHSLTLNGIQVIAEGIETQEHADFVRSVGCIIVQGYLYSRPVNIETFEEMYFLPKTD